MIASSAELPDQHYFRGSFGGKDVIPLYRDPAGEMPNVTIGLTDLLGAAYKHVVGVEDLAAYVYALLSSPSYVERFWNELETPGPHLPLTKDEGLFGEAAAAGRQLIWLHTYAQRFRSNDMATEVPQGLALTLQGVSADPAQYPETFSYDAKAEQIVVGTGRFGPVSPEVWAFEISGMKVVQSWLAYRMKDRAGRKSSPLDDVRPDRWTPRMSDDFLELLWVLDATIAMQPDLKTLLDRIVASPCFTRTELPQPTRHERGAAGDTGAAGNLFDDLEEGQAET